MHTSKMPPNYAPPPPSQMQQPNYDLSTSPYPLRPPPRMAAKQGRPPPPPQEPPESEFRARKQQLLRPHRRTNPMIWCGAVVCVIFSLLLIVAGVVTLVVFLVIKPRNPAFDTAAASLNAIYLDAPSYLNGDVTFLANFSNPNRRISVVFEYLSMELYFGDRLISAQALQPFAQRTGESRLESVHMLSSEVYLPPELALQLQQQVRDNRVVYGIRGTVKVRANLGVGHFSYWLYVRCQIELSAPPNGVLMARSCRTKR